MKLLNSKIISIIIIVVGFAIYSNSLFCSFHFDDFFFIVNSPYIKDISNLQTIWNWWPSRFITFFTLAINYHFYQYNVFGYHLVNLAVHLLSACFVAWLAFLTLSTPAMKTKEIARHARLIALFSGLIFVSHPLQVQAVTYIWQRAASLATLFYLASLVFYVKSRLIDVESSTNKESRVYYACSMIAAVMAMFTKETVITLPLMIALYEFSFFKDKKQFNYKSLIPFIFIFLIIPLVTLFFNAERAQSTHSFVANISSFQYLLTETRVICTYIRLLILPIHQNLDYDYSISKSIFEISVLISFASLIALFLLAKNLFLEYRLISFSIFWFFLALFPESSFFPFGDVICEHRLYLPMAGYSLLLVSGLYYLLGRKSLRWMVIVLTVIASVNSFLTYQRNAVWQNEMTLWTDVVSKSPNKARPRLNLGSAYDLQGDFSKAVFEYNKAIELNPKFTLAYYWRGKAYDHQGDYSKAILDYNKTIDLVPNYPNPYVDRGILYERTGQYIKALNDFNVALELNPDLENAVNHRAIVYDHLMKQNNTSSGK